MTDDIREILDAALAAAEAERQRLSARIDGLEHRVRELEEAESFIPSPSNDGASDL